MARRKAPKQEAPQTIDQAVAMIAEYRDLIDKVAELELEADSAIAQIAAHRDGFTAPLQARAVDLFRQLRAWWGVAAPELTEGKRKSIELAGCLIGERTTPPAFKLSGRTMETLIDKLLDVGAKVLLRTTHKLDKPAAIKVLQTEDDELGALLRSLGGSTAQKDEFFIDRAPQKETGPEIVPVDQELVA